MLSGDLTPPHQHNIHGPAGRVSAPWAAPGPTPGSQPGSTPGPTPGSRPGSTPWTTACLSGSNYNIPRSNQQIDRSKQPMRPGPLGATATVSSAATASGQTCRGHISHARCIDSRIDSRSAGQEAVVSVALEESTPHSNCHRGHMHHPLQQYLPAAGSISQSVTRQPVVRSVWQQLSKRP